MLHLDLTHERRRITAPILILPVVAGLGFDGIAGTALIDTGSTTSGVRASIATKLDLPRRGKRPMSGVGGEIQLERVILRFALPRTGAVPTFPFVFGDISGMSLLDSFSFDALIGMDILSQCDLKIFRTGVATLSYG